MRQTGKITLSFIVLLFLVIIPVFIIISEGMPSTKNHAELKVKEIQYPLFYNKNPVQNLNFHNKTMNSDRSLLPSYKDDKYLLKKMIALQYPQMRQRDLDDWTKVNIVREFASRNIDFGNYELSLDLQNYSQFYHSNATELFKLFLQDNGGVLCGGTAFTLQQYYTLYGYESYSVHSGKVGNFTHASTIVNISYNDRPLWSVQDAYFDETYTDSNDDPIDYFDMLHLLRDRNHGMIKIVKGANMGRDFFINTSENISQSCVADVDYSFEPVVTSKSVKYHARLEMEKTFNKSCCASYVSFIESEGYPSSPLYLYLYPFRVLSREWKMDYNLLNKAQNISQNPYASR